MAKYFEKKLDRHQSRTSFRLIARSASLFKASRSACRHSTQEKKWGGLEIGAEAVLRRKIVTQFISVVKYIFLCTSFAHKNSYIILLML
jgi:hypothetical protein